ncbi:MAG: DegV family EDD domain-containing protein, partial [Clostridia bacterium]|nr:DegV family EDD domain-containing protein [Clostridia bacterium]
MKKYIILADITCDLSQEMRDFCGLEDYVKGHVHISSDGTEKDIQTTLDWSTISYEELYGTLANKKSKVTSAPPTLEEYVDIFEKYVKEGYSILSMSLSSKISGTFDFSCTAAKRVKEKYPEADIYCFNSMRMSGAFALLTLNAHLMKKEGKTFDEVIEWLEANKQRVHQMGPVDDLIAIARRGRITMGKAIMGSFANVKPMGDCNSEGYVTVLTKAKGIRKALDLTVNYVKETATDAENNYAVIYHTDREQYVLTL